jgi:serine protease Do
MSGGIGLGIGALVAAATWLVVPAAQTKAAEESVEVFSVHPGGGRLGVNLAEVTADDVARLKLSEERGALVKDVASGSAAEKAGLKEGDVILRYQSEAVHSAVQLSRMVRETPPGRKVTLEVSRGGAVQRLTATLEEGKGKRFSLEGNFPNVELPEIPGPPEIPEPPEIPAVPPVPPLSFSWQDHEGNTRDLMLKDWPRLSGPRRLGISYQEISGQLAKYFKAPGESGLLVTHVDDNGPAAKAGLKTGDLVVKYDGKPLENARDLREKLNKSESGSNVTLTVQRDGKPLDLKVTLGADKKVVRKSRGVTT